MNFFGDDLAAYRIFLFSYFIYTAAPSRTEPLTNHAKVWAARSRPAVRVAMALSITVLVLFFVVV